MLYAAAGALVVGTVAGYKVRDWQCDSVGVIVCQRHVERHSKRHCICHCNRDADCHGVCHGVWHGVCDG